jgi:putative membrane protein
MLTIDDGLRPWGWAPIMDARSFFTPQDIHEIEVAVKAAETRTSGEIVPYVVGRSDDYPEATWKAAALGALLGGLLAALAHEVGHFWGYSLAWIALPPFAGAAGGILAALVPALRRRLVSSAQLADQVERRARTAFLEQEVFKTRERTGILIFLSLLEHRVVVLADSGINAKVEQREWDGIVAALVAGIRAGTPGAALAHAIERCGALLAERQVERRADDRDELDDRLRIRQE